MFCMLFCLQDSMALKFDRKSRPYMRCDACRHNVFIRTGFALASIIAWSQAVATLDKDQLAQSLRHRENILRELVTRNEKVRDWITANKAEEVLV